MNKDNTEKLLKAFPAIYPILDPLRRSPFSKDKRYSFTFDCHDGWFQLIWDLSVKINKEIELAEQEPGADQWQPIAIQVKEKFGTLRFYCNKYTDGIRAAINEAYNKSSSTCELCGKTGTRQDTDYIMTLCDDHAKIK